MGSFFFNGVKRNELKPGDHIYTYRALYAYSHHGIYVEGNKVVHFTQIEERNDKKKFSSHGGLSGSTSFGGGNLLLTCPFHLSYCGTRSQSNNRSVVLSSCLDCFLKDGDLNRYRYGVNTFRLLGSRGGTCTTAVSDPPHVVIKRAMKLLEIGFGEYKLLEHNCEDFALLCKTGLVVSQNLKNKGSSSSSQGSQVVSLVTIPVSYAFRKTGPAGFVAETTCSLLYDKYSNDLGVRTDVVKLDLDSLSAIYARKDTSTEQCPPADRTNETPKPSSPPAGVVSHARRQKKRTQPATAAASACRVDEPPASPPPPSVKVAHLAGRQEAMSLPAAVAKTVQVDKTPSVVAYQAGRRKTLSPLAAKAATSADRVDKTTPPGRHKAFSLPAAAAAAKDQEDEKREDLAHLASHNRQTHAAVSLYIPPHRRRSSSYI